MKKSWIIIITLMIALLVMTSIGYSASPKVLRLAGAWPAQDPLTKVLDGFAERFNKRAGGSIMMKSHNSESLIKLTESLDAVRVGTVELAAWAPGMFSNMDSRFTEMPFLYDNVEADAAAQVLLTPMYNGFIEDKFNQKVLANFTSSGNELISKTPIKTIADFKGLLGMSFSPAMSNFWKGMGGAPVTLPFTEGYQALDKGVVDAALMVPMMMVIFGVADVAHNMTRGYFIPGSIAISINMDTLNSLPKNIQDILIEEGLQTQKLGNDVFINNYYDNVTVLKTKGVTVFDLDQSERDEWKRKLKPVIDNMKSEMGNFGNELFAIADKVNLKYKK